MSIDDPSILIVDRLPLTDDFRAFVHPSKLGELKLKNGTIVEIKSESGKIVCAPVYAVSEHCQYGRVQLGRALRVNLQCFLGEKVQLKRAKEVDTAECVVLAPIDDTIENITGTYADILFNSSINFENLPLRKNQVIPVFALNRVIEFKVVIAQPTATVIVEDVDVIACRNTTVSRGKSPKFGEICYDDIGGLNKVINKIRQVIELPLLQPKLFRTLNKTTAKDLLITANSGCGKTLISKAIENETFANFLRIDCYSLLTKTVEEAIAFLLKSIDEAVSNQPSIVYFDDFDVVAIPEISEDSNPDSRISNALCSALKRMRAEKSVIVIASARDDSKIRKDIKAKFDRKIDIMFPIGEEKNSIVRVIAHRYAVKYNLPIEDLTASLTGKSGAQLTQSCVKLLLKPIALLARSINNSKSKNKSKDNNKSDDNDDDSSNMNNNNQNNILSINQLKKIVISQYDMSNDADNLFEDTSFDNPAKYKPTNNISANSNNQLNDDSIEDGKIKPLYDPEYEDYMHRCQPNKIKIPLDIEIVDLFEGEPLYNEGMDADEKKKRYTYDDYDDNDDYYSDDDDNDRRDRNRKGGKGKTKGRSGDRYGKSTKNRKNRRYSDDYYSDDYYDYLSDEDDDNNKRKNKKQGKKKAPLKKNNKNSKKKYSRDDDYYDYYSDDENEKNDRNDKNKKNSKDKKVDESNNSKNEKTSSASKRDPFANKDGNSISFPTAKKGKAPTTTTNSNPVSSGFPTAKPQKDFVDPFAKNSNAPVSMPSKKNQRNIADEKTENENKKVIGKKPNQKRPIESDDDDDAEIPPKKKSSSKKKAQEEENKQQQQKELNRKEKNPFGKSKSIRVDDESEDSEDNNKPQKTSNTSAKKESPFSKQSKQLSSSDDDSDKNIKKPSKKSSNKTKSKDDDDDKQQQLQQGLKAPKKKFGLRNKPFEDNDSDSDNNNKTVVRNDPFAKKGKKDDDDEYDDDEDKGKKNIQKKQNKNSKPIKKKIDSDDDDDDDFDEPPRRQTKSKQMAQKKGNDDDGDDDDDDDGDDEPENRRNSKKKNLFAAKKQNKKDEKIDDSEEEEEEKQPQKKKKEINLRKKKAQLRDISDDDQEELSDEKPPSKPANRKRGNPFG